MKNKDFDYKKDLVSKFPELKKIEGFPIGEDKDILALSEPPFYTACPNPYMTDFIREHGNPYNEATDDYHCEPFVGDVSEGKNDPIYNAHSYHTKVPHKAIIHYINHYTQEGEIVFDGFCGTGMTGIAAQLLNRKALLSDLSPIASFISYNYNAHSNNNLLMNEMEELVRDLEKEYAWFYEAEHKIGEKISETKGRIDDIIYSDVLVCPFCNTEYVFWDLAIDSSFNINDEYKCIQCNAGINKNNSNHSTVTFFDKVLNQNVTQSKQVPVVVNYTWNKKRYSRKIVESDIQLINKISEVHISSWLPIYQIPVGFNTNQPIQSHNFTHIHHFFTYRNLFCSSLLFERILKSQNRNALLFVFTSVINNLTRRYRFRLTGGGGPSGNLYIPSLSRELNVFKAIRAKIKAVLFKKDFHSDYAVSTQSTTCLTNIPADSIDYIFTDPPFGKNIMYSEMNLIWESWLRIFTNNQDEAIINSYQNKSLPDYSQLMIKSFREYFRILKPKRWITVEFHNSKSSVWNSIQEAITRAGFIIAQVSVLDKQQGSFKQVTAPGAVEKDLVISAYKPNKIFEEKFLKQAGENLEVDFVYQFLENLPKRPSVERTDKMLYSKMLAYYIQRGYEVRQDSKSFYRLLTNNFIPEDGFWFTPKQISSYREFKQKMKLEGLEDFKQGSMMLFITDESSALLWLFNFLSEPKTFSESSTAFNQLAEIQGDKVPDLKDMLNENFVLENNKYRRPQGEAETVSLTEKKERALMREFEILLLEAKSSKKKIAMIRKEAVLYGFEVCYKQNRFEDMLTLANRLDRSILENSSELTEFVEIARIKVEGIK